MPKGVLNIVTGECEVMGGELTRNPLVRKLSFTGSTEVGKLLMEQCAPTVKRTSMELGGNAPFIVFDDADLEQALNGLMAGKFRNTGQACVSPNRIYVQSSIYDAFVEKLVERISSLKIGDGFEDGVVCGPLIDRAAIEKVEGLVNAAKADGAKALVGGERHGLGGSFYQPTVLTDVSEDSDILRTEIFGPVAPIVRFEDEAEVIRMANDTPFGLASYFYARDVGRVWRVSAALEYGMVGINETMLSNEAAPFGGVKESGVGREGAQCGIDEYLESKYLCMGGL